MYFFIKLISAVFIFHAVIAETAENCQHCFSVLDKLSKNDSKKISLMTFKEIAQNSDILSCVLRESRMGDKSLTNQYFDVYKKSDELYKRIDQKLFGDQELNELVVLGMPYNSEIQLREALKSGNKEKLKQTLLKLQNTMSKNIELSQEYKYLKHYISMQERGRKNGSDVAVLSKLPVVLWILFPFWF